MNINRQMKVQSTGTTVPIVLRTSGCVGGVACSDRGRTVKDETSLEDPQPDLLPPLSELMTPVCCTVLFIVQSGVRPDALNASAEADAVASRVLEGQHTVWYDSKCCTTVSYHISRATSGSGSPSFATAASMRVQVI